MTALTLATADTGNDRPMQITMLVAEWSIARLSLTTNNHFAIAEDARWLGAVGAGRELFRHLAQSVVVYQSQPQ